ncbi:hypothetical protein [Paenibacillus elgii]|uniref:hypothetical protein n=1 Tax=Paenibacillus elgii TaxID=189691 RepID=UPI000248DED3|nr:hypothetical protein [Paenibacillus elgii]
MTDAKFAKLRQAIEAQRRQTDLDHGRIRRTYEYRRRLVAEKDPIEHDYSRGFVAGIRYVLGELNIDIEGVNA